MWFGTQDGLNRFDGFEFTVFVNDPDNPQSISDESVRSMLVDRSGTLWMGTDAGGLSRYNSATQTFTNYLHNPANPESISYNRVHVVYEDNAGVLWVGTDGAGLDRFNRATGTFEHFPYDAGNPNGLPGAHIRSILENSDGELLVATDRGLAKLDRAADRFMHYGYESAGQSMADDGQLSVLFEDTLRNLWIGTESDGLYRVGQDGESVEHFVHDSGDISSVSADRITAIFEDAVGTLWIGTENGLNAWNPETADFDRYVSNSGDRYSLSHDHVASLFQDRGGVLWVGTHDGLNFWNVANRAISHYRHDINDTQSLSESTVMSFIAEPAGKLWVATFGGGLSVLDPATDRFHHVRHIPGDDTSLSSDRVMSLHVDHEGVLWAGTRSAGLNRYDSSENKFTRFRHDPENETSISSDGITTIFEDSKNTLWIGTFGGGLNSFDRDSQQFRRFRNNPDDPATLSDDRVMVLFEDSTGNIWVGTYGGGLNRFVPSTGVFTPYRANPDRSDGLSGDEIYMIQEDSRGDFWISVKGKGLNRWRRVDRERGKEVFRRFTTRDGLPSSTVYSGAWDQAGHLWLGTGRGLSRLDIESLEFKNYDTSHGLQDNEFNLAAGYSTPDGKVFFGGVNGFNAFYPQLLDGKQRPPQVVITKFSSLNKPVDTANTRASDGRVQLGHDQYVIDFEFAALDYAAPRSNRFMYRLDGLDHDWMDAGAKRQVTYTNLPAGKYTFRVKASNHNGVWSRQDATLDFYMAPALWNTWWAYLVYLLALAAVALAVFRVYAWKIRQADKLEYVETLGAIQARLSDAQRIARIGNWELNAATRELWWSDEIYRLFQIVPEPFGETYESFMEYVHPDDRENVKQALGHALRHQGAFSIDYRIIRPDGSELTVCGQAETCFDEDGQSIGMAGTIHDITERKNAENDIRHRADFQALLANLSSELIQAHPDDIGQQLGNGLEAVGARYGLDAISVWWFSADRRGLRPFRRWTRIEDENPGSSKNYLHKNQIPWTAEELLAGRTIVVDDVEQMPLTASADQKIFRKRGIRSLLLIPLMVEETLEGACAYIALQEKHSWSAETVAELQLIADNLAGAIARSRAMSKAEHLKNKLQEENFLLREEVKLAHGFNEIVGEDKTLRRCLHAVEKVAPTDVTALILGETGTGKELIARAIHRLSARCDKPMVSVNCPALPATLIESELFGHEKGAFTGAHSKRRGRFELAHNGTLFLDEIGELSLELQAKLLRVLQTGEFERIGGTKTLRSNIRLIAATNRGLEDAIGRGEFRADLYYRISSFPVRLPSLRDRKGDIPLLAEHFVHKHAGRLGKKIVAMSAKMVKELVNHGWPGNIRELESVIERALISVENNSVLELAGPLSSMTAVDRVKSDFSVDNPADLSSFERAHIVSVLEKTRWKIAGSGGAAVVLRIPPSTLRSKMKRLGISRKASAIGTT